VGGGCLPPDTYTGKSKSEEGPTNRPGESKKIEACANPRTFSEKKTSRNWERKQPRFAQKERKKEGSRVMLQ
jgi:hypothetical protein